MTGVCRAADAMLDGYLFTQSVAEGNEINWRNILDHGDDDDLVRLFVGLAGVAAHLRSALADAKGQPLAALDEELIGALLIEGAAS